MGLHSLTAMSQPTIWIYRDNRIKQLICKRQYLNWMTLFIGSSNKLNSIKLCNGFQFSCFSCSQLRLFTSWRVKFKAAIHSIVLIISKFPLPLTLIIFSPLFITLCKRDAFFNQILLPGNFFIWNHLPSQILRKYWSSLGYYLFILNSNICNADGIFFLYNFLLWFFSKCMRKTKNNLLLVLFWWIREALLNIICFWFIHCYVIK